MRLASALLSVLFCTVSFAAHELEDKAEPKAKPELKGDLAKLQGKWELVEIKAGAIVMAGKDLPFKEVRFEQESLFVVAPSDTPAAIEGLPPPVETKEIKLKLDEAQSPRQIDFTPLDGPSKGKVSRGVYEFDRESLRICMTEEEAVGRPKDFKADGDGRTVLLVMKRAK